MLHGGRRTVDVSCVCVNQNCTQWKASCWVEDGTRVGFGTKVAVPSVPAHAWTKTASAVVVGVFFNGAVLGCLVMPYHILEARVVVSVTLAYDDSTVALRRVVQYITCAVLESDWSVSHGLRKYHDQPSCSTKFLFVRLPKPYGPVSMRQCQVRSPLLLHKSIHRLHLMDCTS